MGYEHEIVIPDQGFLFKVFLFEGKDGHYLRGKHWHRSIEIFAVYEGELTFYINEDKYPLHPGEFVILNSNEIHSIESPKPNKTIVLQMPVQVFEKYYTGDQFILFTHSTRTQDAVIMKLMETIYDEIKDKGLGFECKAQSAFYYLIYLLVIRYRKSSVSQETARYYKRMNKLSDITAYMRDHYSQEMSLKKVADEFGYSPTYLSRMFKEYANTNYKAYLQSLRVEFAFRELANTQETIAQIAMNHGFPDSKAFSREFKKKYGYYPSEYRKRQKNAIN